jgi:hypothetical protein
MSREVLEKSINKMPLLCRWGFHSWKPVAVHFSQLATVGGRPCRRISTVYQCRRPNCRAERTEME